MNPGPPALEELVFYSQITGDRVLRPSDGWLRNPAWIDGALNPPRYYYSREEIEEAVRIWGPISGIHPASNSASLDSAMARISPTPVPMSNVMESLHGDRSPSLGQPPSASLVPIGAGAAEDDLYVVRSTFLYPPAAVPGSKPSKKMNSTVKVFTTDVETITRVEFVRGCLLAHGLSHTFAPGTVSGPTFRMHWTGSGGKTNAASILTDADFSTNVSALLRKQARKKPEVMVEFSSVDLEAFRMQEPGAQGLAAPPVADADGPELLAGTKVPTVSAFSTSSQLHGMYILDLKQKWKCAQHPGEHGEPGHCYQPPNGGDHIPLNLLRLRLWAASWASGDATKHEPPQIEAFDGARGLPAGVSGKSRGRNGPGSSVIAPPSTGDSSMMAMLMGALLPTITDINRKRARDESASPRVRRHRDYYSTPPRRRSTAFEALSAIDPPPSHSPSQSCTSLCGSEIETCLDALLAREGLDLTPFIPILTEFDLTPDVIPHATTHADTSFLTEILSITVGKALKLKIFCEAWSTRRNGKKPASDF
ncbi:hypothetical protein BKA70DRAFT_1126817 [Coprinopsis sp. MPI-PUGE-AT-0042]|nr:hypothetical protein BKA70DRAFT_1126817 [Coprinopsis sp. MPI-PUGE-AT-0042]